MHLNGKIKGTKNTKHWQVCRATETLILCWWDDKMSNHFGELWWFLIKLHRLSDPDICPLLDIYPKEIKIYNGRLIGNKIEPLIPETTWLNLKNTMLSKMKPDTKSTHNMILSEVQRQAKLSSWRRGVLMEISISCFGMMVLWVYAIVKTHQLQ